MYCPRCQNSDNNYFYLGSKGYYCRKCIGFKRILLDENYEVSLNPIKDNAEEYLFKYPLTEPQKEVALKCAELIDNQNVLVDAVCGAGKSEIVVYTIAKYLKQKKKVAFAISRRQVVLELTERFKELFPKASIISVCQGFTDVLDADLIICTTHQLYRYHKAFDLIILDESDAFPYKGNDVLKGIVKSSCKGHIVYLTATPDSSIMAEVNDNKCAHLMLNIRPHFKPLCVPEEKIYPLIFMFMYLLFWLKNKRCIVFVPSIKIGKILTFFLSPFYHNYFISSKSENKDEVIKKFKDKEFNVLIATTILERGVTFEGIDVCVYNADHRVFDLASLIQMSGRVGRSFKYPQGKGLFLCNSKSDLVEDCINKINKANDNGKMYMV